MKVTINNYHEATQGIDFSKFSEATQKAHRKFDSFLKYYDKSEVIKKALDLHLLVLNKNLEKASSQKESSQKASAKAPSKAPRTKTAKSTANKGKAPSKAPRKTTRKTTRKNTVKEIKNIIQNEHYTQDVRLFKRFSGYVEKEKPRRTILNFFRDLQKQITNRTIRKSDKNATLIKELAERMEEGLKKNPDKAMLKVTIVDENRAFIEKIQKIAKSNQRRTSVLLLNRFIGVYGDKTVSKEKVKRLLTAMNNALDKNKIPSNDLYFDKVKEAKKHIEDFLNNKSDRVKIESSQLSGLKKKK